MLSGSPGSAATPGLLPQACQNTGSAPGRTSSGVSLGVTSVPPPPMSFPMLSPLGTLGTGLQARRGLLDEGVNKRKFLSFSAQLLDPNPSPCVAAKP